MMERFKARGITHLVAHQTEFEPKVTPFVVARLMQSPYLEPLGSANGVHAFRVKFDAVGEQSFDAGRFVAAAKPDAREQGKFSYFEGWYEREVYPGEKPFRWMRGTHSSGVVYGAKELEFSFRCPLQALGLFINGKPVKEGLSKAAPGGWQTYAIDLARYGDGSYYVEFTTSAVFKVANDVRDFGCMVTDVVIR
jgi:hypothetical protein